MTVTSNNLRNLRLELSESLSEFGLTLKRAIDPRADRGYSRQYVSRLVTEDEQGNISPCFQSVDHERWLEANGYYYDQEYEQDAP